MYEIKKKQRHQNSVSNLQLEEDEIRSAINLTRTCNNSCSLKVTCYNEVTEIKC